MNSDQGDTVTTLLQISAIFGIALICSVILHKGASDISLLVQDYSGERFWLALAKYFLRNLAGGSAPEA